LDTFTILNFFAINLSPAFIFLFFHNA